MLTSGMGWVERTIKKIAATAVAAGLLLALMSPVPVYADSGLEIVHSSSVTTFPYQIDFNIQAESSVDITDVRLHYRIDQDSFAVVTSEVIIEFTPDKSIDAYWTMDMIKSGGLPSGTEIEYWWTLADAAGGTAQTEIYQIRFDDNRYQWEDISQGDVDIYWYNGDEDFAAEIMQAAQQALVRLAADTGAHLERPVRLYVYASSADLRAAMIFPQEWTGGVAYTTYGVVAIGIGTSNLEWGKRAIVHELTHLVTHQMTYNPYSSIPVWLNEGLSMYAEGEMEPVFTSYLEQAVLNDTLISVRSLASPFSAISQKSYLSYAQSLSLVHFLIDNYGQENMHELLSVFKQGSGYDTALEAVYGFDMDGLDALWRDYISSVYKTTQKASQAPLVVLYAAGAAAVLLVAGIAGGKCLWRRGQ